MEITPGTIRSSHPGQSPCPELKYHHNSPRVRTSLAVLSFIKTPLFKGETNRSRFFFPLMHVDMVGDVVVGALYSGYARMMLLTGDIPAP